MMLAGVMGYDAAEIEQAVTRVSSRLGCGLELRLQQEFEAGLHPKLLAHERIYHLARAMPVLNRHLMGALSFAHQPVTFYDIYRVCRSVNLIYHLDSALSALDRTPTGNLSVRLDRLKKEDRHEGFESTLFEILTAARYAILPDTDRLSFIPEDPTRKTPDILVVRQGRTSTIECKKNARIRDQGMDVRNMVRRLLNPVCTEFRSRSSCVAGEVTFHVDPQALNSSTLIRAFLDSLSQGVPIFSNQFTVKAEAMPPFSNLQGPTLYPSPLFNWTRYRYRVRSDWFGLVHQAEVQHGRWAETPIDFADGESTWINDCDWDAGIKWRIDQPEIVERYRRFAFNTVFKGLNQLQGHAGDTGLHVWLESDYFLNGRRETLVNLFERLKTSQRDQFGWVVVNETLFDVSPQGYFDLIEHAHYIKGPTATGCMPPVTSVFTVPDNNFGAGEFGVGVPLPDIDTL